jgi:hypothetical protein
VFSPPGSTGVSRLGRSPSSAGVITPTVATMTDTAFVYTPHPRIEERKTEPPPTTDDEAVGINGTIAKTITKGVGNMWAFYAVALTMGLWIGYLGPHVLNDPYPFSLMLLVFGGIIQMLLMIAIMVGQQVLGGAADKRALQTYQDAEAVLHEAQQIQAHLAAQDSQIGAILARLDTTTSH